MNKSEQASQTWPGIAHGPSSPKTELQVHFSVMKSKESSSLVSSTLTSLILNLAVLPIYSLSHLTNN